MKSTRIRKILFWYIVFSSFSNKSNSLFIMFFISFFNLKYFFFLQKWEVKQLRMLVVNCMQPLWPTFSVTHSVTLRLTFSFSGLLPTYYQTNFKLNINETSEAEGIADHVRLLPLLWLSDRMSVRPSGHSFVHPPVSLLFDYRKLDLSVG